MFEISAEREKFYQWDINRRLYIKDSGCNEVHFCSEKHPEALTCLVQTEEGRRYVFVPNILLQSCLPITAFFYVREASGAYTKHSLSIEVMERPKPDDYVYTETEVKTWESAVELALKTAKESGDFKGDPGEQGPQGEKGDKGDKGDPVAPIVCDAQGEMVALKDASDLPVVGLKIFGKTTQDGTPTPDAPVALVSVGDDGSVTVSVTDGTEENVQIVEVQTPNGLHGFSVNNSGNYTDSSGKQWTCDCIDFARGVYVKRIERYTFTGNETINKYGNVNKNGFGRWQTSVGTDKSTFTDQATKVSSLCNKYKATSGNMLAGEINNGGTVYQFAFINTRNVAFSTDTMDLDAFRAELAGTTILYRLATPIEIPLTEEELAAYAALRTYKPNTTIFNDAGTGMEASYVADTKAYIDNKFAELAAAVVNNT